jgi:hypothetical protein
MNCPHAIGWEAIEVDTGREMVGVGEVLLELDSDEKNVTLINPQT